MINIREIIARQEAEREFIESQLPIFDNGLSIHYMYYCYCIEYKKRTLRWIKPFKQGHYLTQAYCTKEEAIEFCNRFQNQKEVEEYIIESNNDRYNFSEEPKKGFCIYTGPEFCLHSNIYENQSLLSLGESYEIDRVEQYSSWTAVYLKSFPNKPFSLSFFVINE